MWEALHLRLRRCLVRNFGASTLKLSVVCRMTIVTSPYLYSCILYSSSS
jgi:hypothetical protein